MLNRVPWWLVVVALLAWVVLRPGSVPRELRWNGLPTEPALPQHPAINVYFNQSRASQYRDPYRDLLRYGDDLEGQVVTEIGRARTSVDVAMHELNLPAVALALAERHRRGIAVRVILENDYSLDWASVKGPENLPQASRSRYLDWHDFIDRDRDGRLSSDELDRRDCLWILDRAGVPRIDDTADGSRGSGIMHHKFLVIDGVRVLTGSTNLTLSDVHGDPGAPATRGNANHLLVLANPTLARWYSEEFAWMWGDGPGGAPDSLFGRHKPVRPPRTLRIKDAIVTVQFGPGRTSTDEANTINTSIGHALAGAVHSVDLALFVFSANEITNTLRHRVKTRPGLVVRGVLDPGFAYRPYSAALNMWGVPLSERCTQQQGHVPWEPPLLSVGAALLPRGDKLHHKFAILDSRIVLTGSHNWSAGADMRNDENFLVIKSRTVAGHFRREFERLYRRTVLGPPRPGAERLKCHHRK